MSETGAKTPVDPFLKWAGGKRWLVPLLSSLMPLQAEACYVEPFLGAGSTFFAVRPANAILADSNISLIETFQLLRDRPEALIRALRRRIVDAKYFARLRASDPQHPVTRAARFIYLNRTAFNGLYRVNQRGQFNVPFGCKDGTVLCDAPVLRMCSAVLRGVNLVAQDFRKTLQSVPLDAWIYLDPPYTVMHNRNGFLRYNERLFGWSDQLSLALWANKFAANGGRVILTNAAHQHVADLYSAKHFVRLSVSRNSRMAADACHRRRCEELLIVSRAATPGGARAIMQEAHRLMIETSTLR